VALRPRLSPGGLLSRYGPYSTAACQGLSSKSRSRAGGVTRHGSSQPEPVGLGLWQTQPNPRIQPTGRGVPSSARAQRH